MRIHIQQPVTVTCEDLATLLGLPVLEIQRGIIDHDTGTRGVLVRLTATAEQITADHQAVLADVFGAGEIVVEVAS